MNLKNINNIFLLIIFFIFSISCSKTNKNDLNIEFVENENIEKINIIEEENSNNNNFIWKESLKLNKIYDISIGKRSDIFLDSSSNVIISDDYVYYVNSKNLFIKIDLLEKKKVHEIQLDESIKSNLILPISIIKSEDYFFIGYGNGTVLKIDYNGKQLWRKEFKDILRTPLHIINDNIIVLLNSNKILSLSYDSGNILWEFDYMLDKPSLSTGGHILVKHNLIFFVMPNGRIGSIDLIVGEPVEYVFLKDLNQDNILSYNYEVKLHIYNKLISYVENKNTINTYDLSSEQYIILNKRIYNLKSFDFLNNALVALKNNNILTSYNIKNNNIFWKVDLSKFLSNEDSIIHSYTFDNSVLIFFSTGKIALLNKQNGEILFKQNLKLKNVNLVTVKDNYFIFNQENGKVLFYKQ